jgi:dTDP-4-amino-4,6-dideoxygalactose transaminase
MTLEKNVATSDLLPGRPLTRDYEVPLVELRTQTLELRDELLTEVRKVLDSGWYITGARLEQFEARFAAYCGVAHAVGVATGTDALMLALRALGIGPGDEVITVANTVYATARAITLTGATPVFVDVDAGTGLMDPRAIGPAVTARTRAVLPVHLYGSPVAMDEVLAEAGARGLAVVEDACQAAGASYAGRRCGSFGTAGCFSFYPTKNLGAFGDGGMVVTDDPDLARQVRLRRFYGQVERDVFAGDGTNSRLDEVQAAMLLVKLPHLDRWNARRRELALRYRRSLPAWAEPYREHATAVPNHHLFVVNVDERDRLRRHLDASGVQTQVHYLHPLHRVAPIRQAGLGGGDLPATERRAGTILSLPLYPEMTDGQLDRVVAAMQSFDV